MAEIKQDPRRLTVFLSGDLDHHNTKALREEIDFAVRDQLPPVVVLDFSGVTFMDSSGIGLIMGRSRVTEEYGGKLEIHNPPPHIRKVLRISGADKLAVIRNYKAEAPAQTAEEPGKEQEHEYAQ